MSTLLEKNRTSDLAGSERSRPRKVKNHEAPGILTYSILIAFFAVSAFPLWWSFVIASRQSSDTNLVPPALLPGRNFLDNVAKVFQTVPFVEALVRQRLAQARASLPQRLQRMSPEDDGVVVLLLELSLIHI